MLFLGGLWSGGAEISQRVTGRVLLLIGHTDASLITIHHSASDIRITLRCHTFCNCSTALQYSVCLSVFFSPHSFCISHFEVPVDICTNLEVLSSAVSGLQTSALKAFFISVMLVLIASISFWFFFRISISLITHLFLPVVNFFPLEPWAY